MREGGGIVFERAHNGVRGEIEGLIFEVLEEYGLKPDPDSTDADLEDIEHHYFSRGGIFDVMKDEEGKIIGTVGLYRVSPFECELRKMYLAKTQRGRGLGRLLLGHAIKEAELLGCKRIVLETASVLNEAIGLYKKYGFVKYTPDHISCRCDQAYYFDLDK